ncbi:phosphohexomutase domain-containing protein [Endothiovibrio diazotrophicus]
MGEWLDCFMAYDIRGRIPDQLDEGLAYRIGRAYAAHLSPRRVVVGRDVRLTSEALCTALARGLVDAGVEVLDIGVCGTEEVYFATFHHGLDGGVMVTASHNPMDYNGMKLVREDARPISGDSGLFEIERLAAQGEFGAPVAGVRVTPLKSRGAFIEHLLGYIDPAAMQPLKVVADPGNGGAGLVFGELARHLPIELVEVNFQPDGRFPNGIPNPLLPERRAGTSSAVREHGADLGIAWDGDFDRCFFFDERGEFIEGYYLVGLLGSALLAHHPGAKIIHDTRLTWNTIDVVRAAGGEPIQSKTGHAFIKERMRAEDALYGGEMSAHHYFREFAYCDSGMIPALLALELLSRSGQPLSQLVAERQALFPASGEINTRLEDPDGAIAAVRERYGHEALREENLDGLSLEFADWRLNLRKSNTEPLLRLNVESRGDRALMEARTAELLALLQD